MNLAEFSLNKKVITWTLTLVLLVAGLMTFGTLNRLEDPEFTIKNAQIITLYPGASAAEVEQEVTDLIEQATQELGQLKYVESWSRRGVSIVRVTIKDQYDATTLPQVWDELRRKVGDYQGKLPPGAGPSLVNDDFGDVFGIYVAIYGEGYSNAQLREVAKLLLRGIVPIAEVKKVVLWGVEPEVIYVEMSRAKMAALEISQDESAAWAVRTWSTCETSPRCAGVTRILPKTSSASTAIRLWPWECPRAPAATSSPWANRSRRKCGRCNHRFPWEWNSVSLPCNRRRWSSRSTRSSSISSRR